MLLMPLTEWLMFLRMLVSWCLTLLFVASRSVFDKLIVSFMLRYLDWSVFELLEFWEVLLCGLLRFLDEVSVFIDFLFS